MFPASPAPPPPPPKLDAAGFPPLNPPGIYDVPFQNVLPCVPKPPLVWLFPPPPPEPPSLPVCDDVVAPLPPPLPINKILSNIRLLLLLSVIVLLLPFVLALPPLPTLILYVPIPKVLLTI